MSNYNLYDDNGRYTGYISERDSVNDFSSLSDEPWWVILLFFASPFILFFVIYIFLPLLILFLLAIA